MALYFKLPKITATIIIFLIFIHVNSFDVELSSATNPYDSNSPDLKGDFCNPFLF